MSVFQFSNPGEIWKEIIGFPGYEVSDQGRVRCYWKGHGHWRPKTLEDKPQRLQKGWIDSDGYHRMGFKKDGKFVTKKVYRLVLEAFVGPCPDDCQCRHLDGVRSNDCLSNLSWGTIKENQADKVRHGNHLKGGIANRGEKHWKVKLTTEKVLKIRELYGQGNHSKSQLGRLFGVSQTHIGYVISRKSWNHA